MFPGKYAPVARIDSQRFPVHNVNNAAPQIRETSSIQTSAASFILGAPSSVGASGNTQWPRERSAEALATQHEVGAASSSVNQVNGQNGLVVAQHRYHSESPDTLDSFLQLSS
jgi:hypothetical protein